MPDCQRENSQESSQGLKPLTMPLLFAGAAAPVPNRVDIFCRVCDRRTEGSDLIREPRDRSDECDDR